MTRFGLSPWSNSTARRQIRLLQRRPSNSCGGADKGHILMARAEYVTRAREVFKFMSQYAGVHPVELHTGIKSITQREEIRQQIIRGQSQIVVCVDMLGEGFDLPRLRSRLSTISARHWRSRCSSPAALRARGPTSETRPLSRTLRMLMSRTNCGNSIRAIRTGTSCFRN